MRLTFKYTNALDYLFLPTREKQKLMYEAKLMKTHFSTRSTKLLGCTNFFIRRE